MRHYRVLLARAAEKELDALPQAVFDKVRAAAARLGENPRLGAVKLEDSLYRIRLGEYRVIYRISENESAVVILRVARRAEKTYRGL